MEFSRQEHWRGLPFPSPGDIPDPGIKPVSPALQADCLPSEPSGKPRKGGGRRDNVFCYVNEMTLRKYLKLGTDGQHSQLSN